MTTSYPGALDDFTNPTGTDEVSADVGGRTHSEMHSDENDAIETLQTKVGIDGSTDQDSLDYKNSSITGTAKAVSTEGAQSIAGVKTFTDTLNGTDATLTGDMESDTFTLNNDQVELSEGGTGTAMTAPASSKPMHYNQTAGEMRFLNLGTGITIDDATDTIDVTTPGLTVQGQFIDNLTSNFEIKKSAYVDNITAHTGTIGNYMRIFANDSRVFGAAVAGGDDLYAIVYDKVGTVWTQSGAATPILTNNNDEDLHIMRYDDDNFMVIYADASLGNAMGISLINWNGVALTVTSSWTVNLSKNVTITGGFMPSTTEMVVAFSDDTMVKLDFTVTWNLSSNFTNVTLGTGTIQQLVSLSSNRVGVLDTSDDTLAVWELSGLDWVQVGNTFDFAAQGYALTTNGLVVSDTADELFFAGATPGVSYVYYRLAWDGTDFTVTDACFNFQSNGLNSYMNTDVQSEHIVGKVFGGVHYGKVSSGAPATWTISGDGLENSIEDLSATGQLQHICAPSDTLRITGSGSNDGDYALGNGHTFPSVDKILLQGDTSQFLADESSSFNISSNTANLALSWKAQTDGNYYLT